MVRTTMAWYTRKSPANYATCSFPFFTMLKSYPDTLHWAVFIPTKHLMKRRRTFSSRLVHMHPLTDWAFWPINVFSRVVLQRRFSLDSVLAYICITQSDWPTDPLLPEKLNISQLFDAGHVADRTDGPTMHFESIPWKINEIRGWTHVVWMRPESITATYKAGERLFNIVSATKEMFHFEREGHWGQE